MGACGCGDTYGDYLLSRRDYGSIDGRTEFVTIEVYPGCRYCATAPGVVLHKYEFTAENPEHQFVADLPPVPWNAAGPDGSPAFYPAYKAPEHSAVMKALLEPLNALRAETATDKDPWTSGDLDAFLDMSDWYFPLLRAAMESDDV